MSLFTSTLITLIHAYIPNKNETKLPIISSVDLIMVFSDAISYAIHALVLYFPEINIETYELIEFQFEQYSTVVRNYYTEIVNT